MQLNNASVISDSCQARHTTFKPEIVKDVRHGWDMCATDLSKDTTKKGYVMRKLKRESFIIVNSPEDKFHLTIDPLFNLEGGKDKHDTSGATLFRNTRGVLVRGDIGKQFSFETSFLENQARFPGYISDFIEYYDVAPGEGRVKTFKNNGYDFAFSTGYISYTPNKHFNFQVGHGKHFVGQGYRSLLLSDNAFNYPYLRITSTFGKGKFQYTNLFASFMNLLVDGQVAMHITDRLFNKKAGAFQMLNWSPHKIVQLGIFQGMVWQAADSTHNQHLDFNYFNPVIGVNAMSQGLGGTNNVLVGATISVRPLKGLILYSQFVLDDIAKNRLLGSITNKTGYQAGFRAYNVFTLKNLSVQAEYNTARPYTYTHTKTEQSYTHYNQALAHPLGANFSEAVGFINYRIKDFFTEIKFSYARTGADSAGYNMGADLFASNDAAFYGPNSTVNEHLQGIKTTITHQDFRIGYIINPVTNMNIVAGISMRELANAGMKRETAYYYLGFRTSMHNFYYDF